MLYQKVTEILNKNKSVPFNVFMNMMLNAFSSSYYRNNQMIGKDFTTSAEISQLFGEIIAVWLIDKWQVNGKFKQLNIVEIGAGNGTLLHDMLRVFKQFDDFFKVIKIHIIDINTALIIEQQKKLSDYLDMITWYNDIDELKLDAPLFIYTNELFDALAIKQYNYHNSYWYELSVRLNIKNNLEFFFDTIDSMPQFFYPSSNIVNNSIYELSIDSLLLLKKILYLLHKHKGLFLNIDYGYYQSPLVNSIRGILNHQLINITDFFSQTTPYDITANVNFYELLHYCAKNHVDTYALLTQKSFLESMFIKERLKMLLVIQDSSRDVELLKNSVDELVNSDKMGEKFKFMLVSKGLKNDLMFPFKR